MNCTGCHTPYLPTGAQDQTKYLSGIEGFYCVNPPDAGNPGCLNSRNLTNDKTGLMNYSDAEIKAMFLDGQLPDGGALVPEMPYYEFHNMSADDADAVVAYLRTVPAVAHDVPANDPPWDKPTRAQPVDPATIPAADGGAGPEHGRYLVSIACVHCHTPPAPASPPPPRPVDMSKPFAGGENFGFSISRNLTQDPQGGLAGWSSDDVVMVLQSGVAPGGHRICPPMPAGPQAAFGGLTNEDAVDIASYVLSMPAIANGPPPNNVCH
jgi:mono/diheme cytochrome c family protein